jgi:ATP-dependent Lon protease
MPICTKNTSIIGNGTNIDNKYILPITKFILIEAYMTKQKVFLGDDETDFMPIIPIGDQENDADKNLVIPNEIPLLPLRNTVLFPGVVLPITVGRDKSIKAVNDAYKADKLIGVVAQKDSNIEDPIVTDLCNIGTVAKIVKLI